MDELKLARAQAKIVDGVLETLEELMYDPSIFEDRVERRRNETANRTLATARQLLRQIYERRAK